MKSGNILAMAAAGLAVTAAVLIGAYFWLAPASDGRGVAQVGGPFELVNHAGEPVSDRDFRGEFMLVYFGYSYCPDVCPTDLLKISEAMDLLGDAGGRVQPLFITIDPERDTVEALAAYRQHFHPRLVALTGSPEQIAAAARGYRVYYAKAEDEGSSEYLMDHSAFVYLMGPEGRYLTHFGPGTDAETMASRIEGYL